MVGTTRRRTPEPVRPLRTMSSEERGTTFTDKRDPEVAAMASTQITRRRAFEKSGSLRTQGLDLRLGGDLETEYAKRGWHDIEETHGAAAPSMHDYEHLAEHGNNPFPQPTPWEHLSKVQQGRALLGLKAHGTSMDRMIGDLGRGIDRAYMRGEKMEAPVPFGSIFYEPHGHARREMRTALPDINSEQAATTISMTSPHNRFIQVTDEGKTNMPNVNAAVTASHFARMGLQHDWEAEDFRAIPGEDLNARGMQVSGGGVGFHGNVRRAAYGVAQSMRGVDMEHLRGFPTKDNPKGEELFGTSPKASPFAGSFLDSAAPFHVLDIHMAGIVFPHLSGAKGSGVNINPSGASTGSKSERELAVERIPHSHAAADYAMRQAMGERGLHKTRFQQGGAWGEEQIARTVEPEPGVRRLSYHPERMYGWQASFTPRTKRGVGTLLLPR